ncbi:MAG: hypothetical protein ACK523_06720, partial [Pirellulaceae bacterium]
SLTGMGAAHPSYAKTKKLVEQLETSLAREIGSPLSKQQKDAAVSNPASARPVAPDPMSAKGRDGADISKPLQIDLPVVSSEYERLPVRRLIRLGANPGTRI